MNRQQITILDCTLRDGSYVVDFRFTAEDTARIVERLADAGVRWIEVGHGLGVGAQRRQHPAAATDEAYVEAAVAAAGPARIGCFYIPGLGTRDDLRRARDAGCHFVRVGTNSTEVTRGLDDIAEARRLGLHVSSSLMKSYLVTPAELASSARLAADAGAEAVMVVDSAGGMTPAEVAESVTAVMSAVSVPVGFHGHNNLGLANGCALAACEAGATVIDCTLQGIGRSGGNTCLETLVLTLERLGRQTGIDPFRALDAGETLVRPLLGQGGTTAIEAISGYARFHSSYMPLVEECAAAYDVEPRRLIVEVSRIDPVHPTREAFLQAAQRLRDAR